MIPHYANGFINRRLGRDGDRVAVHNLRCLGGRLICCRSQSKRIYVGRISSKYINCRHHAYQAVARQVRFHDRKSADISPSHKSGGLSDRRVGRDVVRRPPVAGTPERLVLLADLFTLLPFIAWGFAFLAMRHKVAGYDAISGVIFVAYIFVLVLFLSVAYRSERRLTQFLEWVRRLVNRFKAGLISEAWPARTSNEFCHAAHMLVQRPGKLIILAGWGVIVHIINVTGLWALTRAFDVALNDHQMQQAPSSATT